MSDVGARDTFEGEGGGGGEKSRSIDGGEGQGKGRRALEEEWRSWAMQLGTNWRHGGACVRDTYTGRSEVV